MRATDVFKALQYTSYGAFPVVDSMDRTRKHHGKLLGLVLRNDILIMVRNMYFENMPYQNSENWEAYREYYPRNLQEREVDLAIRNHDRYLDFGKIMSANPTTLNVMADGLQLFRTFKEGRKRHVIITDDDSNVMGIITRKDVLSIYWKRQPWSFFDVLKKCQLPKKQFYRRPRIISWERYAELRPVLRPDYPRIDRTALLRAMLAAAEAENTTENGAVQNGTVQT